MVYPDTYSNALPSSRRINLLRVFSTLSCVVLIAITIVCSFRGSSPTRLTIVGVSQHHFTSFTPNAIMTFYTFIGLMYAGQLLFLTKLVASKNEALLISATTGVSYHYILFCAFQTVQVVFWIYESFILVEVMLVLNGLNLVTLALQLGPTPHRTTATKNLNVQIPLVKMPLALTAMWFVQNTAILCKGVQTHDVVHYLFLWGFALFMMLVITRSRDSLLGLAMTYLLFSLGTEQFISDWRGDHWQIVFAFLLATVMFFVTAAVGVPRLRNAFNLNDPAEAQPILG